MNCTKCGSDKVLVESTGNGGTRRTCQACGECAIQNREGKKLLTDEMPVERDPRRSLVEG